MKKKRGQALVVGAGIAGIRSALDLAETGYRVTLIDQAEHLGGLLSRLDRQFPSDACGLCRMLPLLERDAASTHCLRRGLFHENMDLRLASKVVAVDDQADGFAVTIQSRPNWIDPARCLGCGRCVGVCPVEVPDGFNQGLTRRQAVYPSVPHRSDLYVIDSAACTRCGRCLDVCPTGAITLTDVGRLEFRVLVVDDELIVRDSLKEWLIEVGFGVSMAASGPEALTLLDQGGFGLMLLDIKMPGMDGVEVLRRAKAAHPDLTVIMITAYATVDTAVEAMKIGAWDYLIKPFDPEVLVPMIERVYRDRSGVGRETLTVGAVILACGVDYVDPTRDYERYGYGQYGQIMTNLEFERLLSGSGPVGGRLVRPGDGQPIRKIAWLQCVGSRDPARGIDYCSSICCMSALKEARLAKAKAGPELEATVFYMDLRTPGKHFQRYREEAEKLGIRLARARVHTVVPDKATAGVALTYTDPSGENRTEAFDLVVLSVGARPRADLAELAGRFDLEMNQWGFPQGRPFQSARSSRPRVYLSGSTTGPLDIADSLRQAGAAALEAALALHSAGGSLFSVKTEGIAWRDVSREPPRFLVALCRCRHDRAEALDWPGLIRAGGGPKPGDRLADRAADHWFLTGDLCTNGGWAGLVDEARREKPNRVLLGACRPCLHQRKARELGPLIGLDPGYIDVVDIQTPLLELPDSTALRLAGGLLAESRARLAAKDIRPCLERPVTPRALVIGGGLAGMSAALALADQGYPVTILERAAAPGGNLNWLSRALDGGSLADLGREVLSRAEKHPLIEMHTESVVTGATGQAGHFRTMARAGTGGIITIEHGVTILATGGGEATLEAYGHGEIPAVFTQRELERRLAREEADIQELKTVVMILCAGTREEPRDYCSRVCCPTALKQALWLKEQNPAVSVWVFYRDLTAPGFSESYYTRARAAGIVFINYDVDRKPRVACSGAGVVVRAREPILGQEIEIQADWVVLAAGVAPHGDEALARTLRVEIDRDGFFREAEAKWRPFDTSREGVFVCGLAVAPMTAPETVASAQACAMRALRILARESLTVDRDVAWVREALCARCERCLDACPFRARSLDPDTGAVVVDGIQCQGCGICASVCPNGAAMVAGHEARGVLAAMDAWFDAQWSAAGT